MPRKNPAASVAFRVGASIAVSVAVAVGPLVTTGVAVAEPSAARPAVATVEQEWENTAELKEFKTSDDKGTFYTLNEEEAAAAEGVHGNRPTGEAAGIRMFTKKVPGSVPLHRLKQLNVSYHTYIVSSYQPEIDALTASDAPRRFVDKGVIGYVLAEQEEGTMPLYRYAKGTVWRIARDNRQDLLNAGYKKSSGTLGFVPQG
ncbi:hypothetical protein [Pseudonocardia adelaidensis]|uniref:DUF5648 domain-containing protein n=1 Tax=Pseudonocardia adelaidensis TaxID=648754 RepID=A0ABP9NQ36_9PSEU